MGQSDSWLDGHNLEDRAVYRTVGRMAGRLFRLSVIFIDPSLIDSLFNNFIV